MSVPEVHHEVVRVAIEMEANRLVVGTAGNVSGRRADDTICLTPSSTPYRDITPEGLAVVDLDGKSVEGSTRPSTEKAMHLACYRQFPEVGGVVHCHPLHASMFAVAHRPVPPAVEEALVYVGGSIPVAHYAMTGSDELAAEVVLHLGDRSAVLMANHGMLCIGKDPTDALHTALVAEHTAHIVFGAQLLGGAVPLSDHQIAAFAGIYRYLRGRWSTTT